LRFGIDDGEDILRKQVVAQLKNQVGFGFLARDYIELMNSGRWSACLQPPRLAPATTGREQDPAFRRGSQEGAQPRGFIITNRSVVNHSLPRRTLRLVEAGSNSRGWAKTNPGNGDYSVRHQDQKDRNSWGCLARAAYKIPQLLAMSSSNSG